MALFVKLCLWGKDSVLELYDHFVNCVVHIVVWILRNRRLIWWLCWMAYRFVWILTEEYRWVLLVCFWYMV